MLRHHPKIAYIISLGSIGLLLVGLGIVLTQINKPQDIRDEAATTTASLSFSSPKTTLVTGELASATINVNPGTNNQVVGVDVMIKFEQDYLQLLDIIPNTTTNLKTFVPQTANNQFDKTSVMATANSTGTITFGAVAFNGSTHLSGHTTSFPLATLIFSTVNAKQVTVSFLRGTNNNDSNIVSLDTPNDVLQNTSSITFTIQQPTPTPTPTRTPTPTPLGPNRTWQFNVVGECTNGTVKTNTGFSRYWYWAGMLNSGTADTKEGTTYPITIQSSSSYENWMLLAPSKGSTNYTVLSKPNGMSNFDNLLTWTASSLSQGTYNIRVRLTNSADCPAPTPTRTPTPTPTRTPTPWPTRTPTPIPPTSTPTRSLTPSPTRTPTPVIPTITPTRTPTPILATATPTRTPTPVPPTPTPTPDIAPRSIAFNLPLQGRKYAGASTSLPVYIAVKNTSITFTADSSIISAMTTPPIPSGPQTLIFRPEGYIAREIAVTIGSGTTTLNTTSVVFCAGDINGDGIVNIIDYNTLLTNYNTDHQASDLDGSGGVNVLDYSMMLSNWRETPEDASCTL